MDKKEKQSLKVGDKVRVVKMPPDTDFPVGTEGVVTALGLNKGWYEVGAVVDGKEDYWYYPFDHLEKIVEEVSRSTQESKKSRVEKVEVEVEVPRGWKVVRWGKVKFGEHYLNETDPGEVTLRRLKEPSAYNWFIVEKDEGADVERETGSIRVMEMQDRDIGVITKWGALPSSCVGKVVQRRGNDLVAFLRDKGEDHSGLFYDCKLGWDKEKYRVKLVDKERVEEIIRDLADGWVYTQSDED